MQSYLIDVLGKIKKTNKNEVHHLSCQTEVPFLLIGKNATPFTVLGFSKGRFFETNLFTIKCVDKCKGHALLEALRCRNGKLYRTDARILVNLSRFCGIERVISPVLDYLITSHFKRTVFCKRFVLKDKPSNMLWQIDQYHLQNVATISVDFVGTASGVLLQFHTKDGIVPWNVHQEKAQSITIANLLEIEVLPTPELIELMVQVQLNECEKKIIYF